MFLPAERESLISNCSDPIFGSGSNKTIPDGISRLSCSVIVDKSDCNKSRKSCNKTRDISFGMLANRGLLPSYFYKSSFPYRAVKPSPSRLTNVVVHNGRMTTYGLGWKRVLSGLVLPGILYRSRTKT